MGDGRPFVEDVKVWVTEEGKIEKRRLKKDRC